MAFWRADLDAVDGFDAAFKGWGREDSDIFIRLIRAGVRRKDGTTGNMLVTVEVMVPKDLNSKARSAIEELREATAGQDPREELLERAKEA